MSAEVAKQSICGPRGHYVFPPFFKLSIFRLSKYSSFWVVRAAITFQSFPFPRTFKLVKARHFGSMLNSTLSEKRFSSIFIFPDFPNIPRFEFRLILVLSSQMCVGWNLKWADVEVFHTKTAIYLNGQHLEVFHIRIFIGNCTLSEMLFLKRHFVHRNSDVIFDICKRSIPIPLHYSKVQNLPFKIIWWTQKICKSYFLVSTKHHLLSNGLNLHLEWEWSLHNLPYKEQLSSYFLDGIRN